MFLLNSLLTSYPFVSCHSHHKTGRCVPRINGKMAPRHVNHSGEAGSSTKQSSLNYVVEWLMKKNWPGCPHLPRSFFHSLSHTHTHMRFTSMQKCGLFTCQKHHQTMSYSAPLWVQWEVPGPTSPHTISPKACPTPTIVPHSTHTHTQWPLQSQGSHYAIPSHKDTHQSLSRQREKKEWQRRQKKNCNPWGGRDGGK